MKLHFRFSRSASEDESSSVKDKEDLMAYSTGAMMSSAGYSKSSMMSYGGVMQHWSLRAKVFIIIRALHVSCFLSTLKLLNYDRVGFLINVY